MRASRTYNYKAKTPKTPDFQINQIWNYATSKDEHGWSIIGIVTKIDIKAVTFDDIIIITGEDKLINDWSVVLPLASDSVTFNYIGTKEKNPEYFL